MNAAQNKKFDVVDFLLSQGADDALELTALLRAICTKNTETAEFLLNRGANIDIQDKKDGLTPLSTAAELLKVESIRFLLEHGADIDVEFHAGNNAIEAIALSISSEKDESRKLKREKILEMMLKKKKPQISEEEIAQQKKLSLAKMMLNLTYSRRESSGTKISINIAEVNTCSPTKPWH